jgi:hypothetical protein
MFTCNMHVCELVNLFVCYIKDISYMLYQRGIISWRFWKHSDEIVNIARIKQNHRYFPENSCSFFSNCDMLSLND